MTPGADILQADGLKVYFKTNAGRESVKAVDGVSFGVQVGQTFGIIGESGSGKSTLGRVLVGLLHPTEGRISHGDRETGGSRREIRERRRDYQIVFQDPNSALNPRMRIIDSVREPLDILDIETRKDRNAKAMEAIERVGLRPDFARRFPHQLSGGQKQRVNIARVLTLRPKLIVCDEIVAALDVSIQADVLNLLADLQQELNLTYVFITHDLGVVSHISDQIAIMYLGRFMEQGPAEQLTEQPLHPYTEALLSAEPVALPADGRKSRRILLTGEIPSAINPPSGCRFRTRCSFATGLCGEKEPEWREFSAGHFVACHYAGSVTGQKPLPQTSANQTHF
jgi:peptide/nickel transport system ATP-binding protein/oligopeptide transport system ATP-binding protein